MSEGSRPDRGVIGGEEAVEVVQLVATSMTAGGKAEDLERLDLAPHPAARRRPSCP